jgi:glycosyltransferase involved in cell wall biosynthesis
MLVAVLPAPAVSVCIRGHGRPDALAATIESVLAQSYADFEVVVSDDSGGLETVTASFADPRVHYHLNPAPAGPAANLKHAVDLSRGRFIAILNDDDLWLPRFLAGTVAVLESDPEIGIVFTNDSFEIGARRTKRDLPYAAGRHDRFLAPVLEHGIPASATVMRRRVWDDGERATPLTSQMVGDGAVWLRSAQAGWPFYYLDEPLAVSRIHRGQVSWSEDGLPTRMIATHAAFRFDDPVSESLRRARLAEFLLARAHGHLVAGRLREALADVARAHRQSPRPLGLRALLAITGLRRLTMRWGSSHPNVLVPVLRLWRRIRPPVLRSEPTP